LGCLRVVVSGFGGGFSVGFTCDAFSGFGSFGAETCRPAFGLRGARRGCGEEVLSRLREAPFGFGLGLSAGFVGGVFLGCGSFGAGARRSAF